MNTIKAILVLAMLTVFAVASQSPEPPLDDSRLTIHTLVREDIFAGFLNGETIYVDGGFLANGLAYFGERQRRLIEGGSA